MRFRRRLVAAWQGLSRLRDVDDPWPWLAGIAAHKAADVGRRRRVVLPLIEDRAGRRNRRQLGRCARCVRPAAGQGTRDSAAPLLPPPVGGGDRGSARSAAGNGEVAGGKGTPAAAGRARMRAERMNEVEERRVIRLLAGLADDVPALRADEIQRAVAIRVGACAGHVGPRPLAASCSLLLGCRGGRCRRLGTPGPVRSSRRALFVGGFG